MSPGLIFENCGHMPLSRSSGEIINLANVAPPQAVDLGRRLSQMGASVGSLDLCQPAQLPQSSLTRPNLLPFRWALSRGPSTGWCQYSQGSAEAHP